MTLMLLRIGQNLSELSKKGTVIPDDATVADVTKAIFPNADVRTVTNADFEYIQIEQNDKWIADVNKDVWNEAFNGPWKRP